MCLGLLTGCSPVSNNVNILSELNTGNIAYVTSTSMEGNTNSVFHENLISLLDRVFTLNSLEFLSIEQRRFVSVFLYEAGIITDNEYEYPYDINIQMKEFDNFLGGFK